MKAPSIPIFSTATSYETMLVSLRHRLSTFFIIAISNVWRAEGICFQGNVGIFW